MRNGWFCWINMLCMIAVVHAHLVYDESHLVVRKLVTLAVPLFALIAGYSWGGMLKKTKGEGAIYGLKLFLIPYLGWAAIYFVLNRIVLDVLIRHEPWTTSFSDVVYLFATGMVGIQLWYMPALLLIAFLTTLLYRLNLSKKVYGWVLAISGLVTLVYSGVPLFDDTMRWLWYSRYWMCWMVPNFVFGVLFSVPLASKYSQPQLKRFLPILWIVGLISISIVGYRGGETLLAIAIFTTALAKPKVYMPQWVLTVTPCIMGIYMSHVLFTSALNVGMSVLGLESLPDLIAWPVAICIFFASWLAVLVMRKIPVVKNLV